VVRGALPIARGVRTLSGSLPRSHDADSAPFAIRTDLNLERDQFIQSRAHAVARKSRYVDK
jgi:hypothetical protein